MALRSSGDIILGLGGGLIFTNAQFNLLERGCQIYCLTPPGLKELLGQILKQKFECRLVEGTGRRKLGAEIGYW